MDFRSTKVIAMTVDMAFCSARDDLLLLQGFLPDVGLIEPIEQRTMAGVVERRDRWHAAVAPMVIAGRSFSKAIWVVTSCWDAAEKIIHWQVDVEQPVAAARCYGRIAMRPMNNRAAVNLEGHVKVYPKAVGFRFGPMIPGVRAIAERLLVSLIERNLSALMQAVESRQPRAVA